MRRPRVRRSGPARAARRTCAARLFALALVLAAACPKAEPPTGFAEPPPDGTQVVCPVSRARCVKTPATPSAVFAERTYYFCCETCPRTFAEAPEKYIAP